MASGSSFLVGWVNNPQKNSNTQSLDRDKRKRLSHPAEPPLSMEKGDMILTFN